MVKRTNCEKKKKNMPVIGFGKRQLKALALSVLRQTEWDQKSPNLESHLSLTHLPPPSRFSESHWKKDTEDCRTRQEEAQKIHNLPQMRQPSQLSRTRGQSMGMGPCYINVCLPPSPLWSVLRFDILSPFPCFPASITRVLHVKYFIVIPPRNTLNTPCSCRPSIPTVLRSIATPVLVFISQSRLQHTGKHYTTNPPHLWLQLLAQVLLTLSQCLPPPRPAYRLPSRK